MDDVTAPIPPLPALAGDEAPDPSKLPLLEPPPAQPSRMTQLEERVTRLEAQQKAFNDLLNIHRDSHNELASRVHAAIPAPPPAPSVLAEFTRPKAAQWPFAWHGRPDARPMQLPSVAIDHREAVLRARWGYDLAGGSVNRGASYDKAWKLVERIRAVYEGGALDPALRERFDGVDLEFACFGTLLGLWAPSLEEQLEGQRTPADFKGWTVDKMVNEFNGKPAETDDP